MNLVVDNGDRKSNYTCFGYIFFVKVLNRSFNLRSELSIKLVINCSSKYGENTYFKWIIKIIFPYYFKVI
jgi:hypothetical protein